MPGGRFGHVLVIYHSFVWNTTYFGHLCVIIWSVSAQRHGVDLFFKVVFSVFSEHAQWSNSISTIPAVICAFTIFNDGRAHTTCQIDGYGNWASFLHRTSTTALRLSLPKVSQSVLTQRSFCGDWGGNLPSLFFQALASLLICSIWGLISSICDMFPNSLVTGYQTTIKRLFLASGDPFVLETAQKYTTNRHGPCPKQLTVERKYIKYIVS